MKGSENAILYLSVTPKTDTINKLKKAIRSHLSVKETMPKYLAQSNYVVASLCMI